MRRFHNLEFPLFGFVWSFDMRIANFRFRHYVQLLCAVLALTAIPEPADAHLVNTGLGPFYDGILHLFISPEDLLAVFALGLLAGLGGPLHGRWVLFGLTGAWIAGGLAGLTHASEITLPLASILPLTVLGVLVALDSRLPVKLVVGFALALGLAHGFLNGTALVAAKLGVSALVGIACAVFVMIALVAALVLRLEHAWARNGVRVAGSWIAAVGVLMVGWAIRGN
jgi:hydrogenase/urease accessory protein HupE